MKVVRDCQQPPAQGLLPDIQQLINVITIQQVIRKNM